MISSIELSNRAARDLKRIGPGVSRARIVEGLRALAAGDSNLDVKALEGRAPWLRLRVGDFRVLYRPIEGGYLVARIVNRRDLDRAVDSL